MPVEPRITIRALLPLLSGLRALGHDPDPWLHAVGVDVRLLQDPDCRVPMSTGVRLLAAAVQATGDDNIGLHVAERAELNASDVHFYAMASSPTLGVAFERLARYQRLIHDTSTVRLEIGPEQAVLRHVLPDGRAVPRQTAEFLVAAWVRAGRAITGVDWAPRDVCFAHAAPRLAEEHRRYFRCPVRFAAGEHALVLPAALLQTPCLRPDPALLAVIDRHADDRLARAPMTAAVADRVRSVVEHELRGHSPTARETAAHLRVSVRTLHRLLGHEHTSFQVLLDTSRRERAVRQLADDDLSIAEIAFALGFKELSSFTRAFKRWTGTAPGAFRARRRSAPTR